MKKCIRCGARAVKPRTGKGRTTRYRTMPFLRIPDAALIPTCARCGSEYLDEKTCEELSPQLHNVYLACLRTRVRLAIDILSRHIPQRRLERLLGLSQGYLSRLRAGAGNPSPELVSHLALLCHDAPRSLSRLQRFWTLPDDEWPPEGSPAPHSDSYRRTTKQEEDSE